MSAGALAARAALVGVGLSPWFVTFARALPIGHLGDLLDRAFVPMCHRLPERTLAIFGVLMPLCSRCAGLFAGIATGALTVWPALKLEVWRIVIGAAAALMLLDIVTQDLGVHPVWHASRLSTGALLGHSFAAACISAIRRT